MKTYPFHVTSSDHESELQAKLMLPDHSTPRVIIQIIHGITEHSGRYEELCRILTSCFKFGVLIHDQIGHGKSVPENETKLTIKENGWHYLVKDIDLVRTTCKEAKSEIQNVPFVLLGFSLGSFVVRDYLTKKSNDIYGAIIAGTGWQPKIVCDILIKILHHDGSKHGHDIQTDLTKKMLFDNYNQQFGNDAPPMAWLSEQESVVNEYLADPLNSKTASCRYFKELLRGMSRTCNTKAVRKIPNIPILLISGCNDPVGGMTKGVETFKTQLLKTKHTYVETIYVPNARHDVFHGTHQDNIIPEIVMFSENAITYYH